MFSLLRWASGSDHDPLTDKVRIQEEERCRSRVLQAMNPGIVKRKRGKSTQSVASQQRPAKRTPQYLSHVEVPSAKNSLSGEASTNNFNVFAGNGDLATAATPGPSDNMDLDEAIAADGAVEKTGEAHVKDQPHAPGNMADQMTRFRQVIETEFDLEILLKHNELRLIDQEIAKCQIALEQLRRCSVIPYPAMTSSPQDMLDVSNGTGIPQPSVPGIPLADQPPPWGVVDGPYSRHYAQWLLPDRTFDGGYAEEVRQPARAGKTLPDRHTRGNKMEKAVAPLKARTHRSSAQSRSQALSAGYAEAKEDKGPMILKRVSDGKLVKLVCPNCHRENFNSAQGFINHCRIAHSHNLASHEVATKECGQEIDPNEVMVPPPDSSTAPSSAHPYNSNSSLVHPLIRRGMVPRVPHTVSMPATKNRRNSKPTFSTVTATSPTQTENLSTSTPFTPATQVPHLSALFARLQQATDLPSAVSDATRKEDFAPFDSDDDEAEEVEESSDPNNHRQPEVADSDVETESAPTLAPLAMPMLRHHSRTTGTRGGPANTSTSTTNNTNSARVPKSRKGLERTTSSSGGGGGRRPDPSSLTSYPPPLPRMQTRAQVATLPGATTTAEDRTPQTLSPQTLESNNAPSLVSDDDDEGEEEDDTPSSAHGTPSPSPSSSRAADDAAESMSMSVEMRGGGELGPDDVEDANDDDNGKGKAGSSAVDLGLELGARRRGGRRVVVRSGKMNAATRRGRGRVRGTRGMKDLEREVVEQEPEVLVEEAEAEAEAENEVKVKEVVGKGRGGRRRMARRRGK
ncbi:MAG: hypothetical protein LQ340_006533 [Diploschistes diacapsis]|nr:MAG: hypothetical protein LQ340_006533 [Diploschistes diacapsis]